MSLHHNPVQLLQTLIRFDTSNPPGNEGPIIRYLDGILRAYGVETTILAKDDNRPNLIARLPGTGEAPPLILQGHVDVVPVTGQEWTRPPFAADLHDGYVWGRGALDMKGGVAMLVCAFLSMCHSDQKPRGDIILCLLSDEERRSRYGARFLVEEHPERFANVKYSIGEFGGFPMTIAGAKCYPIQIAERVGCQLKMVLRGPGGHGAMPLRNGAMASLGRTLTQLNSNSLPIHITPPAQLMIEGIADACGGPAAFLLRQLLNPKRTESVLKLLGPRLSVLEPMLRNTVNATVIETDASINVIPSEVTLKLDGRMLPGITPEQMIEELREIVGNSAEITQIDQGVPGPDQPDMSLFPLLTDILCELDHDAKPVPFMMPAVTDGRWFAKLGIQNYGFLPLNLSESFNFTAYIHAADERVPVESIQFGTQALTMLLHRYTG